MQAASWLPRLGIALAPLAAFMIGLTARADVTYTEKIKFGDAGGLGKSEITRRVALSGLMEREESIAKMIDVPGYPPGVHERNDLRIYRLDKGLVWTLDPKSKTYTESTTEQMKTRTADLVRQAPPDQMREAPDADVRLSLTKVDGAKVVGSWQTEGKLLTIRTEEIDASTGERRPTTLTCELWLAREVPGQGEMREFAQAYMDNVQAMSGMAGMQLMAASFPKAFGRAFEAIKGIPGTPVEWTWTVRRALVAKEASDLKQDVSILDEERADLPEPDERESQNEGKDARNLGTRAPDAPIKGPGPPEAAEGGVEGAAEMVGVTPDESKGIRVVMKVVTSLEKIETAPVTPRMFEIPDGYTKAAAKG